jgi:histidine triad (HIT) family protein
MCIFCKLANKEIPTNIVYEDEDFIAMLDISQTTKGHTLVVPKKHAENILEMSPEDCQKAFKVVKIVTDLLNEKLSPKGFNILNNNGVAAGQTVFHFHIHIIPRYENDGVSIEMPNNSNNLEPDYFSNLLKTLK